MEHIETAVTTFAPILVHTDDQSAPVLYYTGRVGAAYLSERAEEAMFGYTFEGAVSKAQRLLAQRSAALAGYEAAALPDPKAAESPSIIVGFDVRYLGMTKLPEAEERRLLSATTAELLRVWNTYGNGRRLLAVGDHYRAVQLVAAAGLAGKVVDGPPPKELDEVKRSDIPKASNEELLAEYNARTGKAVRRFASRAVAERRVAAVLPPERVGRPSADYVIRFRPDGNSSVRENSNRGAVLAAVRARRKVRKSELDEQLGFNTAGYISKLAKHGHVEVEPA